mgnify:CR=1 FL=1
MLILGKPTHPPQYIDFNRRLFESMEQTVATVGAGWSELAEGSDAPAPEVCFGGRYMIVLDDTGLIRRDEPLLQAQFIWSVVHGISMLVIDGQLGGMDPKGEALNHYALERLRDAIRAG